MSTSRKTFIHKYENGQISSIRTYENGKINGVYIQFYENGNLRCEGTYKNYKRDGFFRGFHENGQLHYQFTMIDDETICNDYEEYDELGKPSNMMYLYGIDHNKNADRLNNNLISTLLRPLLSHLSPLLYHLKVDKL